MNPKKEKEHKKTIEEPIEKSPEEESCEEITAEEEQIPPTPEEAIETLHSELEQAQQKADENLDGWQRAAAEFANYKKRIERDQKQLQQKFVGDILLKYVEIIEDFDRALENRPEGKDGAEWAAGIEIIYRKFVNILENEGVTEMEVEGQLFNPNFHEAIAQEESPDHESGEIIETISKGYMIGERVLRPAVVKVAS